MKKPFFINLFKSNYCRLVFALSLLFSYFLIPNKVFFGRGYFLAGFFMLAFSLSITCIVHNIKEKIFLARTYKTSVLQIVLIALGLSALQLCGIGAPICGASLGLGVLAALLPNVFLNLLGDYAVFLIIASSMAQILSLYFMNCFKLNGKV